MPIGPWKLHGNSAADPDAASSRTGDGGTIDRSLLDAIGDRLGAAQVSAYLAQAVQEAEQACCRLADGTAPPEEIVALAHRLCGTASSFGLVRIGAAAATIEQQARAGRDIQGTLLDLTTAIADTRREALDVEFGSAAA